MPFDRFFWFSQPATTLNQRDFLIAYIFAGVLGLAIIFFILSKLTKHRVFRKTFKKFWVLFLVASLTGGVWFGLRYENTPIFGRRYWAIVVLLAGVVWLGFVLKYLIVNFRSEKKEYDRNIIKSKYLPK
jgi:hypothetical protein